MSSAVSDIIDLFAAVALHLRTQHQTPADFEPIISFITKLNKSLNPEQNDPTTKVLDTALSLMCFKAPQVFEARGEFAWRTVRSLLSGLVYCKVVRVGKQESLVVGCEVLREECLKLIEVLGNSIGELDRLGIYFSPLLCTVVQAAVSAHHVQCFSPDVSIFDIKPWYKISPTVSRLLPLAFSSQDCGIQFRLLMWYLDPSVMKSDLLKIMQEVKERPFLCLSEEFHCRTEWRCTLTCLVLCPSMYIAAMSLLQYWLLLTGFASVLQLRIQLISSVLDVLSRPTWWGISMDMGTKLAFSHAYFPHNCQLLRVLAGQVSCEGFARLVEVVEEGAMLSKSQSDPLLEQAFATNYKSMWSMAIAFPDWFLFASILLFYDGSCQPNFPLKCALWTLITEQLPDLESPSSVAARYISWILSPYNKTEQRILADCLAKTSASWTRQTCLDSLYDEKESSGTKNKRAKLQGKQKNTSLKDINGQWVEHWLKKFQDIFTKSCGLSFGQHALFRRIVLGVLLVYSSLLSEDAFDVLLRYVANVNTISSHNSVFSANRSINSEESDRNKAIAGACLVFELTDAVKHLSNSLLMTDEQAQGFLRVIIDKSTKYFLQCIKILLQLELSNESAVITLKDIRNRLVRWKCEGVDANSNIRHLDDMIVELGDKLSSL
ncbi:hypothetical protein Droror1_Dr00017610 [Drosera rotundifolia]